MAWQVHFQQLSLTHCSSDALIPGTEPTWPVRTA